MGKKGKKSRWMSRELPGWINGVLVFGTVATLLLLEKRRPLRKSRQDKLTRNTRNFALSSMSAVTIRIAEKPVTTALARTVERNRLGLLKLVRLPAAVEVVLSVALLDYTLYIWHYLTHKVPFLWRFHQVHHVDLDLDASTALRFHFGEMLLSVPWRALQVVLLGTSLQALSIWQLATLVEILFHHSNVRLPAGLERRLCRLLVTPRMHGIHHSVVQEETDSNWSTIFPWPDYIHGTIRLNVPQQEITIGVAAFQDPKGLSLWKLLAMPLTANGPSWQMPGDGRPKRTPLPPPKTMLAT